MAVPTCAAQAATFTIATGDVDALKSAINSANASSEDDTINLSTGNYELATAQNTVTGPTALPPLKSGSGTLTINGNGAVVTRSNAQNTPFFRALRVEVGAIVVINNLTVSRFKNTDPATTYPNDTERQGGAIENLGKLTLNSCTINSNESLSGGAINNEGTLLVNQGTFNSSRARRGGSLKNSGTAALNDVSFFANAAGYGGSIENTGTLTMNRGIAQSNESNIGGAIQNSGTATLNRINIVSNRSFTTGMVNNEGMLTLSESMVTGGNSGGITNSQNLFVRQSLIAGNSSRAAGAGIYTTGALQASNSTFRSNSIIPPTGDSPIAGSALAVAGNGSATVDSCTFADNSELAAIAVNGGTLTLRNSIVARTGSVNADGERSASDIVVDGGNFSSGGHNLIGNSGAVTSFIASDQVGTAAAPLDPGLGDFRENGGATNTYSLLAGSPALNKGDTALTTDQRGLSRPAAGADDIGAFEAQNVPTPSVVLVVTTLADVEDATDGVLSLREAILRANANDGPDTIRFADNMRGAIALSTSLPEIYNQLTIEGPGASLLALDGGNKSVIFSVNSREIIAISGLTFRNANGDSNAGGTTSRAGGAIGTAGYGLLQLRNCAFLNNRSYNGGAVHSSGNLLVEGCTFSGNSASEAGALYVSGTGATIRNSTFTGNNVAQGRFVGAGAGSGISVSSGSLSLDSCTVTDNTIVGTQDAYNVSGGGVSATYAKSIEIRNSILSGNANGDVVRRLGDNPFVSKGNNLVNAGNALSAFSMDSDQTGVADAKLGPLADNGGPTQTRALLPGSPAIDKGQTALATDQRGIARPQGGASDIGAYEVQSATPPSETPSLIVTTLADVAANDGQTSLREAIAYANAKAGADTITFANNVRGTLALQTQLPVVTGELTIQGAGAKVLTVDGGGATRLLRIASDISANINDLTLANGKYAPDDGRGGALLNEGNLTLRQVWMTNNTGIEGGAFANLNGSVTLVGCLLSGNAALNGGGGFLNNNGLVTVINSTISGNVSLGNAANASGGGGISTFGDKASVRLECVTLAGNSAPNVADNTRAGVWLESGALSIHNSILSGNGACDLQNDGGAVASAGYNILGQTNESSGLAASDRVGANPQLGALADNGGPTQTRALLSGSAAINTGDPAIQSGFDQRGGGFARVRGGIADVGAFEVQSDAATPTVSLAPQNPTTNQTLTASPAGFGANAVYAYLWKKNGVVIAGEISATLDLSKAGNGDAGDVILVEVRANNTVRTAGTKISNSAPFAFSRNVSAPAATEVSFELRGSDPDGDALTFELLSAPANGGAEIRVDPTDGKTKLFYRSRARYNGVEVVRFVAVDAAGAKSSAATLGIAVKYSAPPVNRAPIAGDTNIDTYVGDSVVKGLLGRDPDGDALVFRIVNNAKFGKSEIRRDSDGQFKLFYTSLNRFYGPDRVTYVAVDSNGAQSNVATIGINFINRAPVAQNNSLAVATGETVSQYLFGTDADGDALTFRLVNNPRYGRGAVQRDEQGNWRVYYQSVPGYVGPDRITFIAIDPQGKQSNIATADIDVVRVASTQGALRVQPRPSGGAS